MQLVHQCAKTGLQVSLVSGLGIERDIAERQVLDAGVPLALCQRAVWTANLSYWDSWFLLVRDENGRARAGIALDVVRTRAMPGHIILRVARFGGNLPGEVCRAALIAIANLARNTPKVLRVQLNVFARTDREAIAECLKELGFREVRLASAYRYTLAIDLKPSEEEIFAALGKPAQKRIRESIKKSLRSVPVSDPVYADRIKQLQQEALQRTGGHAASKNWLGILRISQEHPNLSSVFGLFQGEDTAPENMLAFAWVCHNGDHAEYRAAGSTRSTKVRVPLGYLPVWEMVRWAKANGAEWFDMGGVTLGAKDETALKGITLFKESFSHELVEVGAEWELELEPVRARIVTLISVGASHMRELVARLV
jgi:hypothetical protein